MTRKKNDTTTKPARAKADAKPIKSAADAIADTLERNPPAYEARPRQETPADDDGSIVDAIPRSAPEPGVLEMRVHSDEQRSANPFDQIYNDVDPDGDEGFDDYDAKTGQPIRSSRGPLTFSGYDNLNELPAIPTREGIGPIADIFHASGWFGDLTPAQIATKIIIGQSLGLDPAQSVIDLDVGPGPVVAYLRTRPFEIAADAIAADRAPDLVTPKPASPAANAEPGVPAGSTIRQFPNARIVDDGIVETPSGNKFDVGSLAGLNPIGENANKGPLLDPEPERPLGGPQAEAIEARPDNAEALADSGDINANAPAPEPEIADPSIFGTSEPVGNEGAELVAGWREQIVTIANDVGGDGEAKGRSFDALSRPKQREMFYKAVEYHRAKVAEQRKFVLDALAADGKTSIDAQRGFFLYAEVPADPAGWNYAEARKAAAAITEFTSPGAA